MVYDGRDGDIINQYVEFTKVCNRQIEIYGRTKRAIQEAVRICRDKNILKDYLESRKQEVVDMMMELYDEQEILRSYVESERFDAAKETAKRFLEMGKLSVEEIAAGSGLSLETVLELQKEQL